MSVAPRYSACESDELHYQGICACARVAATEALDVARARLGWAALLLWTLPLSMIVGAMGCLPVLFVMPFQVLGGLALAVIGEIDRRGAKSRLLVITQRRTLPPARMIGRLADRVLPGPRSSVTSGFVQMHGHAQADG